MRVKTLLVGLLATAAATATVLVSGVANAGPITPYIVGGDNATETYSFMVSLQDNTGRHFCGGSLIKENYVVTAAHCVQGKTASKIQVRVGSTDRTKGGTVAKVSQITVHPKYRSAFDIAVVKLSTSVKQTPIAIAASAGAAGTDTRIIGWGQTCPTPGACGAAPVTLQQLDTSIVADSQCSEGFNAANEICTDNPNDNAGACYGDSGGPQIKMVSGKWQLIGATSRAGGAASNCAVDPSIYTDVTAFKTWINRNTGGA